MLLREVFGDDVVGETTMKCWFLPMDDGCGGIRYEGLDVTLLRLQELWHAHGGFDGVLPPP